MRTLLHNDLRFEGPMATMDNADAFVAALTGFSKMTKGIEMKHIFVDGSRACCVYDLVTDGPIGTRPVKDPKGIPDPLWRAPCLLWGGNVVDAAGAERRLRDYHPG